MTGLDNLPTLAELSRALVHVDAEARQERIVSRAREERQPLGLAFGRKGMARK